MAITDAMTMVGPVTFAGSILLMIAILLGLVASIITYLNSRKLSGEVFEIPFIYFATGLFLVTFSLIDVTFFQYLLYDQTVALIHNISFIIGLALMLVASIKITRFLTGIEVMAHRKR